MLNKNNYGVMSSTISVRYSYPVKPDQNPDPTRPRPVVIEPEKNDPTRIEEPRKPHPPRIDDPPLQEPSQPDQQPLHKISILF